MVYCTTLIKAVCCLVSFNSDTLLPPLVQNMLYEYTYRSNYCLCHLMVSVTSSHKLLPSPHCIVQTGTLSSSESASNVRAVLSQNVLSVGESSPSLVKPILFRTKCAPNLSLTISPACKMPPPSCTSVSLADLMYMVSIVCTLTSHGADTACDVMCTFGGQVWKWL